MDDIRIICPDEYSARRALKQLTVVLRKIGLSVNAKKTEIVSGADKERLEICFETGSELIQKMDELWRKRSRIAIFQLWPMLKRRTLELIDKGNMDGREFRYCVKRLELLARYEDLRFSSGLFAEVTTAICQALSKYPHSTELYASYLSAVDTTEEDLEFIAQYLIQTEKSIYSWQNYRLWLLLAEKRFMSDELSELAVGLLRLEDTPSRAGASIYLGALGSSAQKFSVAENFENVSSFLGQRAALLAIHELPYELIRDHVAGSVREDLKGSFKVLKSNGLKGKYLATREKLRIGALENEVSYE